MHSVIPQGTIDDLAGRRPDWRRRVFEGAGHLLPLETPDGYVRAVDDWCAPPARSFNGS